ncbi:MAG TPA: hypothetical protein VFP40_18940 [Terriglobales bacterium]|nr:hypothetical protein [Terriglobales bacterium]
MKKQISDQVERPTRTEDRDPKDVLGPETTEPSAFSHSDNEPTDDEKKSA